MVNRKNKEINYLTCSIKVVETQWPCFTFDHLDLKLDQLTIWLTFTIPKISPIYRKLIVKQGIALKDEVRWHGTRISALIISTRSKPVNKMLKGVGNLGERVRDVCCKNLFLFTSADLGIKKFLIGWAIMSNLLTCISKEQPWCSIKGNVFY